MKAMITKDGITIKTSNVTESLALDRLFDINRNSDGSVNLESLISFEISYEVDGGTLPPGPE